MAGLYRFKDIHWTILAVSVIIPALQKTRFQCSRFSPNCRYFFYGAFDAFWQVSDGILL
jgi:hypothetical protein